MKRDIIGFSSPDRFLHDLSETQKIRRDVENKVDSQEFKKKITSRPRKTKKR